MFVLGRHAERGAPPSWSPLGARVTPAGGAEFLDKLLVEDILFRELVTAELNEDSLILARRMRAAEVRRVPVVNDQGDLVGILSADDLVGAVHSELAEVAALLGHQHQHEARMRP
jgi:CBS domain-containing protein